VDQSVEEAPETTSAMLIGAAGALAAGEELVDAEPEGLLEELLAELALDAAVADPPPHPARAAAIAMHMSDNPHRAWRMSLPPHTTAAC